MIVVIEKFTLEKLNSQIKWTPQNNAQTHATTSKNWATFTYYVPYVQNITNLFKHTNVQYT
jgi:hypothetical protein